MDHHQHDAVDDEIVEALRTGAARVDADETDVDALVRGALHQGHRRRTRQRIIGGATGLAAVALLVATATTVLPPLLDGSVAVPAATPSSLPTAGPPSATGSPSASPPPPRTTAPTPTERVSGRPADVRNTLTALLPRSLEVESASATRDEGSNGFAWENDAALTVHDAKGTSYVYGGVGNGAYTDACFNLTSCTKRSVPGGGTLWISSGPAGDKTGRDRNFYYNRPAGGHTWLSERNYPGGSVPTTRAGLPLDDSTGRTLVTDPRWDGLFRG